MISYIELKEKSKELEKKHGLNHYEVLQRFMFERVLERISVSKYNDNFILKGGLLLSAMFGVDNRTTKDMDTTIKGIDISKENIVKILNEIFSIDLKDGVKFNIVNITDIREDDEYGGNKYHIEGRLQSLLVKFEIDISTGDEVTPKELKFKYPLLFKENSILINSYNFETILSEKIETILTRGQYNSRMKDYYDVYNILTKFRNEINVKIVKKAINNTFEKRDTFNYLYDYENIINGIIDYDRIHNLWDNYKKKNKYADGIDLDNILRLLLAFLEELNIVLEVV